MSPRAPVLCPHCFTRQSDTGQTGVRACESCGESFAPPATPGARGGLRIAAQRRARGAAVHLPVLTREEVAALSDLVVAKRAAMAVLDREDTAVARTLDNLEIKLRAVLERAAGKTAA